MSSKSKIAMTAIVSVLVLAIIGLTVGLVIVASQATINSNMSVSYSISEVDCTVVATGTYNTNAIMIGTEDGTYDQESITIDANPGDADSYGGIFFESVVLDADGVATYTFAITNNSATVAIARSVTVTVTDKTASENDINGNITVTVNGVVMDSNTTTSQDTIATSDSETITITCEVTNDTLPANADIAVALTLNAQ